MIREDVIDNHQCMDRCDAFYVHEIAQREIEQVHAIDQYEIRWADRVGSSVIEERVARH